MKLLCDRGTTDIEQTAMERKGLIAIQLDNMKKEDLFKKGNRISKLWSAWSVVDVRERLVVSVIWRPILRGVESTRMKCVMCQNDDICWKCRHEIVFEVEIQFNVGDEGAEREEHAGSSGDEYSNGSGAVGSDEDGDEDIVQRSSGNEEELAHVMGSDNGDGEPVEAGRRPRNEESGVKENPGTDKNHKG